MASISKTKEEVHFRILKTGHLYKQGGSYRNWKMRYFVLRKSTLTYYAVEGDKKPKGVIDLTKGRGVRSKCHCFLLDEDWPTEATEDMAFGLAVTDRTYHMYGCDIAAVEDWMAALEERIQEVGCPSSDYTADSIGKSESMSSKVVHGSVKFILRRRTRQSLSSNEDQLENEQIEDDNEVAAKHISEHFDSSGSLYEAVMEEP